FHLPSALLPAAHVSLPGQLCGVTNTKVVSSRSADFVFLVRPAKSPSAFFAGLSSVPNSHPDVPSGIHGVADADFTEPSHPLRCELSNAGKSTRLSSLPVEFTRIRNSAGSSARASMRSEAQASI